MGEQFGSGMKQGVGEIERNEAAGGRREGILEGMDDDTGEDEQHRCRREASFVGFAGEREHEFGSVVRQGGRVMAAHAAAGVVAVKQKNKLSLALYR
jgi:hypothetical protein